MSDVTKIVVGALLVVGGAALTIFTGGALSTVGFMMMSVGLTLFQAGVWGIDEEQASIRSNITGSQSDIPIIYGKNVEVGHVSADVYTWSDQGDALYMAGVIGVTSDNGGQGIDSIKQIFNKSENMVMGSPLVLDTWGGIWDAAGITTNITTDLTTLFQIFIDGVEHFLRNYSYHAHSGADTDNAVDAMLAYTRPEAWPATSKGDGLAYVVSQFGFSETLYSALPQLMYIVDGNKIEDFRTSGPTLYDSYTNPALVLYDYLVCKRYGLGIDPSEIDITGTFTSVANWCDLTTELGGSQYGKLIGSGNGLYAVQGTLSTLIVNAYQNPDAKIITVAEVGDIIKITSGVNVDDEHEITAISKHGSYGALDVDITPDLAIADSNMGFEIWRGDISAKYEMPNAEVCGALLTGTPHKDNVDKILETMRGKLYWQDGKIKLWVRKPETAQTFVLDSDTNVSDIEIVRAGIKDVYNTVSTRYVDPAQNYEVQEIVWPPFDDTNLYLEEDNDVPSQLEVEYPLVQNAQIVWRLAEIALKESRQDVTVRITTTEAALQFSLGDVVKLNDDTAGWTAKEFWVFGMTISDDNTVEMLLKEYDSSVYTSFGQMTESGTPGGRLPSPLYMLPPTGLTLTSDATTVIDVDDSGDNYLQQILVEWLPSGSPNLYKEEVYYKVTTDARWTFGGFRYLHERDSSSPYKQELLVGPVKPDTLHDVKVEAISRLGIRSTAVTDTITTGSVTIVGGGAQIPIVSVTFDDNQVTLIIDDPDGRVSSVGFKNREAGVWDVSWDEDTVGPPWDLVHTITLSEKHNSYMLWRVGYDSDTKWIENAATWDIDDTPEWNNVDASVDASGDVYLNWIGDDDVKYIRYKASTSGYPTWTGGEPPDDPDLEGTRVPTDPDEARSGTTLVYSSLAEGATCFVTYYGFTSDGNDWTGALGKSQVTRPTDTTTDTVFPAVQVTAGVSDITLLIDDPNDVVNAVGFRTYTNSAWGSWTDDTSDPYLLTWPVVREEKHNVYIAWRVRYDIGGGNKYLERSVMFDPDNIPEISSIDLTVDDSGDVLLAYSGDDDTLSVKYILHASGYQSRATVIASGTILDGTSRTDEVLESGIAEGASRWLTLVPYSGANGTGTPSYGGWSKRVTRPVDTDTQNSPIPIVSPEFDGLEVVLTFDDPDDRISSVWWHKYQDGSWDTLTEDEGGEPYNASVTLSEKHNSYLVWKVGYDTDAKWIWGAATWDSDNVPEWNDVSLAVDAAGDVWLTWLGDDDVYYIRYKTSLSSHPSWGGDPDTEGTRDPTSPTESRSGRVKVYSGLAEGATCFASYYGFVSDGDTWTGALGKAQVTRPTDTVGGGILIPQVTPTFGDSVNNVVLTLVVDDPEARLEGTHFRHRFGIKSAPGSWTDDVSFPYGLVYTVVDALDEVLALYIEWQIDYDNGAGSQSVGGMIHVDPDLMPRASFSKEIDDSGNVSISWIELDDDVTGVKALASKSSTPTEGNVKAESEDTASPSATLVTLAEGETAYIRAYAYNSVEDLYGAAFVAEVYRPTDTNTTDPSVSASFDVTDAGVTDVRYSGVGIASIRWATSTSSFPSAPTGGSGGQVDSNGDFQPGAITEGQTRYVSLVGYVGGSGDGDETAPLYLKITRATDTDTNTIVPTVATTISNPSGTTARLSLVVNDPDGLITLVQFREKAGKAGWSGWGTPDGGSGTEGAPYYENVGITEKHNSYVEYQITYTQSGTKYLRGGATFDPDNVPEISSLSCYVTTNGNPLLSWTGDDDVGSIRYDLNQGSAPSWPSLGDVQSGNVLAGRTGEGIDIGSVSAGNQWRVGVLAYTDASGNVGEGPEMYQVGGKRYTEGEDNLPTMSVMLKVGVSGATAMRWMGRDIKSVRYDQSTSSMPSAPTGGSGGDGVDTNDGVHNDSYWGRRVMSTLSRATPNLYIALVGYTNIDGTGTESEPVFVEGRFGAGIDDLDDVDDSSTYRKTKGTYVDSSGRIVKFRKTSGDVEANAILDTANNDFDDVPEGTTYKRPKAAYIDSSGRIDTIHRPAGGTESDGDDLFDAEDDDIYRAWGVLHEDVAGSDGGDLKKLPKHILRLTIDMGAAVEYPVAYQQLPILLSGAWGTDELRDKWSTSPTSGAGSSPKPTNQIFWQELYKVNPTAAGVTLYPVIAATAGLTVDPRSHPYTPDNDVSETDQWTSTVIASWAPAYDNQYKSDYDGVIDNSGNNKSSSWSFTLALQVKLDTDPWLTIASVFHSGSVAAFDTEYAEGTLIGNQNGVDDTDTFRVMLVDWSAPPGGGIDVDMLTGLRYTTSGSVINYANAAKEPGMRREIIVVGEGTEWEDI